MKGIRTLLVVFENSLSPALLSSFRGAIIAKVGQKHQAFHNHNGKDGLIYKYPSIQYKIIGSKAALQCIGEGVDEIHNFFGLKNWDVNVQGKALILKIDKLDLHTFNLNVWDKFFHYSIYNWLALNAENYKKYQAMAGIAARTLFLEKLLTGNILSFAKGVDWRVEKPVKVEILKIKGQKMIRYKGVSLMAFDVIFKTNVFLPNYLGLGKSASHGFG